MTHCMHLLVFEADLFQKCCMRMQKAGSDLSLVHIHIFQVPVKETIAHSSHRALIRIQI